MINDRNCEEKEIEKNKIRTLIGEVAVKTNRALEICEVLSKKYELDIVETGCDVGGWPQEACIKIYDVRRF